MRRVLVVVTLTTSGCLGPDLGGEWEGELRCAEGLLDVLAGLEEDGRSTWSGDMKISSSQEGSYKGLATEVEVARVLDMTVEAEGRGEQDLDYDADLDEITCELYIQGLRVSDDCQTLGIDTSGLGAPDLGDLYWDGEDTIDISDGACSGELERTESSGDEGLF